MALVNNGYILIISAVFPPEPVVSARLSMDLYTALKGLGYMVKVIHPIPSRPLGFIFDYKASDWPNDDEVIVDSYICPRSSLFGRTRESISFGNACAKFINSHCGEILLVYNGAWPLFGQLSVARTCVKHNIRFITPVQDVYPESFSNKLPSVLGGIVKRLFMPMDKYILSHSDRIHVISGKMMNYLSTTRSLPIEKFVVVMNWQDERDFVDYLQNNHTKQGAHPFTFMYMGNIGPVAGVDLLIDAFNHLNIEDTRLVIAGSGSMKKQLVEKAKGNNRIIFREVPNGKVPEIQAQADVMLLPIKKGAASSSIPSKLPAYMFSAKPIIGSMDLDSDTANAIKNAECGSVVEAENEELLSSMMKAMFEKNQIELESLGENGQRYALEHFSKKKNLDRLITVFEELYNIK